MPQSNVLSPPLSTVFRPVLSSPFILRGEDDDALLYFRAVGDNVSSDARSIVNNFFKAEKNSGAYYLTDDYWALWGENTTQALISLKQRRAITPVASPTFTANRGYVFNGTTQYLNTGFIPLTHGVAMVATSQDVSVYERTAVSAGVAIGGFSPNSLAGITLRPRTGSVIYGTINCDSGVAGTTIANSLALTSMSRSGSTFTHWQRGVSLATVVPTSTGATLGPVALYIGCNNSASTAATFRAASIGFACVGAALSAAQKLSQSNNVQAWATAIGAQV